MVGLTPAIPGSLSSAVAHSCLKVMLDRYWRHLTEVPAYHRHQLTVYFEWCLAIPWLVGHQGHAGLVYGFVPVQAIDSPVMACFAVSWRWLRGEG